MQTIRPVKRGGRRTGAGRPKGACKYGELSVRVRVPAKPAGEVEAFIRKAEASPFVDNKRNSMIE